MKKILMVLASLAMLVGLVASSQARTSSMASGELGRTTTAPPAMHDSGAPNVPDQLKSDKRLSARQLKSLGLKPLAGHKRAKVKRLLAKVAKRGVAQTSMAGTSYMGTYQYYGISWYDRYFGHDLYYHSNHWYFSWYDNYKTCTGDGSGCIAANAFFRFRFVYYYGEVYRLGDSGPHAG